MGRGLLESVYHQCLKEELLHRKINFQSEMKIPVMYKNKILDIDFRCDFLLNNALLLN
ncbi:GxxExxY protein [Elizabethkingia meningoseptica]|nr:GxxExxY protein [Elizabethkingia meningoseptica]MDX8574270.1 GxxExxY protein [Elizabethkingia sp. HX WYD]WBS76720.1 GxxExxY protein [Elizabethkingia meningoseptica]